MTADMLQAVKTAATATVAKGTFARSARHIAMTVMRQSAWVVQANVKYVMSPYVQAVFRNVLNAGSMSARDVSVKIYVWIVNS